MKSPWKLSLLITVLILAALGISIFFWNSREQGMSIPAPSSKGIAPEPKAELPHEEYLWNLKDQDRRLETLRTIQKDPDMLRGPQNDDIIVLMKKLAEDSDEEIRKAAKDVLEALQE